MGGSDELLEALAAQPGRQRQDADAGRGRQRGLPHAGQRVRAILCRAADPRRADRAGQGARRQPRRHRRAAVAIGGQGGGDPRLVRPLSEAVGRRRRLRELHDDDTVHDAGGRGFVAFERGRGAGLQPPRVAKKPFQVTSPNGAREDDYYWLRDDTRKNPEMLAYLKAENAYADAQLAPLKPLQDEALRRDRLPHQAGRQLGPVPQERLLVRHALRDRRRIIRSIERRKGAPTRPTKMLFDEPAMAKGHGFFALGDWAVSPDNRLRRLGRGHRRPPPIRAQGQGPRHRRDARRHDRQRRAERRLGRRQQDASSTSRRTR